MLVKQFMLFVEVEQDSGLVLDFYLCSTAGLSAWHRLILLFLLLRRTSQSVCRVPLRRGPRSRRARTPLSAPLRPGMFGVSLVQHLPVFLLQDKIFLTLRQTQANNTKYVKFVLTFIY